MSRMRIALYSHDAMGLGHLRRNLLIARRFVRPPTRATVLLISGACELNAYEIPRGVDRLTLPALSKEGPGIYLPRRLRMELQDLLNLRSRLIDTALDAFRPDLFIVDKLPRGLQNELEPGLDRLRQEGRTKCVLGLRDILDQAVAVQREWRRDRNVEAIRDYFDQVWIFGDPGVYDQRTEYDYPPEITAKIRYTGYLNPRDGAPGPRRPRSRPPGANRLILCQMGGGQDGAQVGEAFLRSKLPPLTKGVLLTGPFMPRSERDRLQVLARENPAMRVLRFERKPERLLEEAERVVSMGGYNSLLEVLSLGKPMLVVPRAEPRREQLIRARRFADLGLLEMLHPQAATPERVADWLLREPAPPTPAHERIDMNGLKRLAVLAGEIADPEGRGRDPGEKLVRHVA